MWWLTLFSGSVKKRELLLWEWWGCGRVRVVRAIKKGPMGWAGTSQFQCTWNQLDNYYLPLQIDQSRGFRMLRLRSWCCLLSPDFYQPLICTSSREKGSNFRWLGVSSLCWGVVAGIYTFTAGFGNGIEGECSCWHCHWRGWRLAREQTCHSQ